MSINIDITTPPAKGMRGLWRGVRGSTSPTNIAAFLLLQIIMVLRVIFMALPTSFQASSLTSLREYEGNSKLYRIGYFCTSFTNLILICCSLIISRDMMIADRSATHGRPVRCGGPRATDFEPVCDAHRTSRAAACAAGWRRVATSPRTHTASPTRYRCVCARHRLDERIKWLPASGGDPGLFRNPVNDLRTIHRKISSFLPSILRNMSSQAMFILLVIK